MTATINLTDFLVPANDERLNGNIPELPPLTCFNTNYFSAEQLQAFPRQESKNISCLHLNANRLLNKLDKLELLRLDSKNINFTVIGISETWLNSSNENIANLNNY